MLKKKRFKKQKEKTFWSTNWEKVPKTTGFTGCCKSLFLSKFERINNKGKLHH
jgi:hypothetical protein